MRQIGAYLLIILNIRRFITKIVRLPKGKWFHPNAQGFNEQSLRLQPFSVHK